MQVLVNLIDRGMNLQEAIDAARYRFMSGRGVLLEDGLGAPVIQRLIALGHARQTCGRAAFVDGRRPGNHDRSGEQDSDGRLRSTQRRHGAWILSCMSSEVDSLVSQADAIANDARKVFGSLKRPTELEAVAGAMECGAVFRSPHHFQQRLPADNRRCVERPEEVECLAEAATAPGVMGANTDQITRSCQTRKMKAPKRFQPAQSDVSGSIIHDFAGQQEQLIQKIKATANLDLERIVITSPAASLITTA